MFSSTIYMCSRFVFTNTPLVLLSERDLCFDVAKIWFFMENSKKTYRSFFSIVYFRDLKY